MARGVAAGNLGVAPAKAINFIEYILASGSVSFEAEY